MRTVLQVFRSRVRSTRQFEDDADAWRFFRWVCRNASPIHAQFPCDLVILCDEQGVELDRFIPLRSVPALV